MTPQLELLGRPAAPSVVEGGFAVDDADRRLRQYLGDDDGAILEARLEQLGRSKRVRRQVLTATRYALRRGVQSRCSWLPKSVRYCGSRRPGAQVSVGRSESGHSVWLGVNRCGDPRACPVCSAAVTARRRDELLAAFDIAREHGWSAMACTLTVRHGIGNDPAKLTELLSKAYRYTFERQGMRKLLKAKGFRGAIRIVEVNYSDENGYHPHLHVVLMFDRATDAIDRTEVEAQLFLEWVLAVNDARIRVGLECGLPDALHGVTVQRLDLSKGPEYFVKVGLVAELLGQFTKAGRRRGSRSMWEVARDMVLNDRLGLTERAAEDEDIWHGYVQAMKHFKSFFVAKRIRALLCTPLQLGLELGDKAPPAAVVYTFTDAEYTLVCHAGPLAMAAIDEMVEGGKAAADIAKYLAQLEEYLSDLEDKRAGRPAVPFAVTDPPVMSPQLEDRQSMFGVGGERTARMLRLEQRDVAELFDELLEAA